IKVVLIDSLNKRINFLNEVIKELELTEIIAIHTRSEEFGVKNKEQFDVVTARAVASLPILMEICVPLVKVNKYFIPMKANISDEEIKTSNACDKLSISIEEKIEFKLPFENSNRCLLKYKKIKETNKIYPRKYSEIKKKPL
ncbi:MAG: RsmG family class I SAM-dependent methyltransferase, partial [Bacilli bacterium]